MAGELTVPNPDYTETDRGWAWIILVACFFIEILTFGSVKRFGILFNELVDFYGESEGMVSWIPTIGNFLMLVLGILANYLCELLSYRIVVIAGGILIALGYLGSAFASQIEILFFTYGLLAGFGFGCIFLPTLTIVSVYFDKRRGLAIGIMISGAGVGSLLLPHLYEWLIKILGIQKTFLVLAGIMLSIICFAFLLKQPRIRDNSIINVSLESDNTPKIHRQDPEGGCLSDVKSRDTGSSLDSTTDVYRCFPVTKLKNKRYPNLGCFLLKMPSFLTLLFSIYFANLSYYPSHVIIPAHLVDIGFRAQEILIVSCMGIGDILGRIAIGWFSDLGIVDRRWIYVTVLTLNGVISICVPLSDTVWMMVTYSLVFSITTGAFLTLIPPMCVERIGVENVSSGIGIVSLQFALGSLTGRLTTGWLRNFTGSWNTSFDFTGTASLIAAAVVCFDKLYIKTCCKADTFDVSDAVDKNGRLINGMSYESTAESNELSTCSSRHLSKLQNVTMK